MSTASCYLVGAHVPVGAAVESELFITCKAAQAQKPSQAQSLPELSTALAKGQLGRSPGRAPQPQTLLSLKPC